MRYALVIGGAVATVVEQASLPTVQMGGQWVECAAAVGPGWTYSGGNFAAPVAPAPARYITQLAFLSRFTDAEAIGIDLASIGATEAAAGLRRYQAKVAAAKFIDLDRADTRAGVQALEAGGLLAAGRALQILDAPVTDDERP